ncbi:MAG: hypothetical protein AB9834_03680 [Lentimicrobium sp.]
MMKKVSGFTMALVLLTVFSALTSHAQYSTFRLSDYKNPDYLYQSLMLDFAFSNGLSITDKSYTSDFNYNNFSLGLNAGGNYLRYSNSLKRQSDLGITLNTGINSSFSGYKYNQPVQETKSDEFRHFEQLQINVAERFYNQSRYYFEMNAVMNNAFSANNRDSENETDTSKYTSEFNQKNFNNSISASLLAGKGRIEQVQDARLALYLLDDLHKLNRDKRVATDGEIIELAELITSLKNKRFFDDRIRKIAEITAIDSFMQKKGIAGLPDAGYFTSLNDNWNYANNPARFSGYRAFAGIEANLFYNNINSNSEVSEPFSNIVKVTDTRTETGLFLVAGIVSEQPLNLSWQRSAGIKGRFGMKQEFSSLKEFETAITDTTSKIYSESIPSINITADWGYGFYPNSRTWLLIDWELNGGFDQREQGTTKEDKTGLQNDFYLYTGPDFSAYYYISEKIRLSLNFNGHFSLDDTKYTGDDVSGEENEMKTINWSHSIRASLTYSLF